MLLCTGINGQFALLDCKPWRALPLYDCPVPALQSAPMDAMAWTVWRSATVTTTVSVTRNSAFVPETIATLTGPATAVAEVSPTFT